MNVLLSNVKKTSGTIFVNGKEDDLIKYQKLVGYVPQEDIMVRTLTVREILNHSARIRLPSSWTESQVQIFLYGI